MLNKLIGDAFIDKYVCIVCGYEYDPEIGDPDGGIKPGTKFENIPEEWVCHYVELQNLILKKLNKVLYVFKING